MSAQSSPVPANSVNINLARKGDSLWREALRRLLRNRAAIAGGMIILLLVIAAVGADFIVPRSEEHTSELQSRAQ